MTQEALKRVAEKLRRTGASISAPEVTGTIEGSVVTGLCIALALVETEIEALAQPEQEPVAHLWQHGETGRTRVTFPDSVTDCDASWFCVGPLVLGNTTPPQRTEQNFCSRCGKRTADLTHIHTCTPPKENT